MYYEKLSKNNYGIDWINSIGSIVEFEYDDVKGNVIILDYKKSESKIGIKYLDNDIFYIRVDHFKNCSIGKYLGKFTKNFKYEINEVLKNEKRDITITERKVKTTNNKNIKLYKYKCNVCGFDCGENYKDGKYDSEHWIREGDIIIKNIGCACCKGNITVENINSIVAKEDTMWMVKYFQGGYDEAKKYTKGSSIRINFKCPYCNTIKSNKITINCLNTRKSIGCVCGDGFSYPEKIMFSALTQLGINFKYQYTPNWSLNKRYDFYLYDYNIIIETHGEQHYKNGFVNINENKTLIKEQQNDKLKEKLAKDNNIKNYIIIDCRYSVLEWIKNNVLKSELNKLFNLKEINWLKCEEFALNNLTKQICGYWNNKEEWETTSDLSKVFKISRIRDYLKKGTNIGLTTYNPKEELVKNGNNTGNNTGKTVEVFKDGISIGVFKSCAELERQGKKLFGVTLKRNRIYDAIREKQGSYKGFKFKYI